MPVNEARLVDRVLDPRPETVADPRVDSNRPVGPGDPKDPCGVAVNLDIAPPWWAFHCHLLYHLEAGMFATFRYV